MPDVQHPNGQFFAIHHSLLDSISYKYKNSSVLGLVKFTGSSAYRVTIMKRSLYRSSYTDTSLSSGKLTGYVPSISNTIFVKCS